MYRPVDLIEVRAWGQLVSAVTIDPSVNYYVFEYDATWQERGIELAPLTMPTSKRFHIFPLLPEDLFKWLPAMLAVGTCRLKVCFGRRLAYDLPPRTTSVLCNPPFSWR